MITNFKIFEAEVYDTTKNYIFDDKDSFFICDVMDYLSIKIEHPEDSVVLAVSKYNVDFIDFVKEIILNKNISFVTNRNDNAKCIRIRGIVEEVSQLFVDEEFLVRVRIKGDTSSSLGRSSLGQPYYPGWHLIDSFEEVNFIHPDKYDAEDKPLHKEMILKKESEKFNL